MRLLQIQCIKSGKENEYMSAKVKIKHLKPGTVFNAGPVAVRVLEHFPDGKTLVITDGG